MLHPFGLTLFAASVLLAGAMALLPGLDRWAARAPWVLIWGLAAYAASVTVMRGSGPGAAPRLDTPRSVTELMEAAEACRAAIARQLRAEAVEHPATLAPLTVAAVAAVYLWLVAPIPSAAPAAAVLLGVAGVTAAGSLVWRLVRRNPAEYDKRTHAMLLVLDERRRGLEQAEVRQTRNALRRRFERIGSEEGRKALSALTDEYERLRSDLSDRRDTDPLSIFPVPALATESYRRGLDVLSSALELMRAARGTSPGAFESDVDELEKEIEGSHHDGSEADRLRIKQELLATARQRQDTAAELRLSIELLLNQAHRSEAALHRTRIQLATIRTGSSASTVDTVVRVLQDTIDRAKEVQQELNGLGY